MSRARWKVAGALHKPKGILLKICTPQCVTNAVLSLSRSSIGICQYPLLQSNVENMVASPRLSKHSSIRRG
jgi:hypothetical protein